VEVVVSYLGSPRLLREKRVAGERAGLALVVAGLRAGGRAGMVGLVYQPAARLHADPARLPALRGMALAAARCSTGRAIPEDGRWIARGDPMEAALDVLARRLGVDVAADERARPAIQRFPFDARRRRMSVRVADTWCVKGAPDAVLPRCPATAGADAVVQEMSGRGRRVLAIASRRHAEGLAEAGQVESGLDLLGLVGIEDPPRPGAAATIAACRRAGIRVAMVTGDHPGTARAIAREVGLLGDAGLVVQGAELPADEQLLGALVDRDGIVVSRVSSEDKLRIARALRRRGHVVAMTGDGVNDGPALHEADIGVAMGRSGTDVAREAADLVLLEDDLAIIVMAIEQGRATFSNIRRFLTYHLTDNVAELAPFAVWALSGGRFPLALGVLQILSLDLGTDQLPALGLGAEAPSARALERGPRGRHLVDRALLERAFLVLGPVEAVMEMTAFTAVLWQSGWRPGAAPHVSALLPASGAAFAAVVIGQAANAFACRSTTRAFGGPGWRSNPLLLAGIVFELALLAGCLFIAPLAALLGQAAPPLAGWVVAALTGPAVLAADAAHKWVLHRRGFNPVRRREG
jgi:magnesium-transporting ATPase (P-type)